MKTLSDIRELSKMAVNFTNLTAFSYRVDSRRFEADHRRINNLYLITDGSYEYSQNDPGNKLTAGRHDIVILPKECSYVRELLDGSANASDFGSGICLDFVLFDESGEELLLPPRVELLTSDKDGYYEKIYRDAIAAQLDSRGRFAFRSIVYHLFDQLLSERDRFSAQDQRWKDIAPAINSIERSPQNNLSIDELAHRCNLSQTRLRQLFKDYTGGMNPVEYRNSLRITKAKELLLSLENSYSMESIAEMLGFYDASYFIKTFLKLTGMTPKEFRLASKSVKIEN